MSELQWTPAENEEYERWLEAAQGILSKQQREELRKLAEQLKRTGFDLAGFEIVGTQRPTQQSTISVFQPLRFLEGFSWFCGPDNREILQLIIADLKKDIRKMKSQGWSPRFINTVLVWHVFWQAILPVTKDGLVRFAKATWVIKRFKQVLLVIGLGKP